MGHQGWDGIPRADSWRVVQRAVEGGCSAPEVVAAMADLLAQGFACIEQDPGLVAALGTLADLAADTNRLQAWPDPLLSAVGSTRFRTAGAVAAAVAHLVDERSRAAGTTSLLAADALNAVTRAVVGTISSAPAYARVEAGAGIDVAAVAGPLGFGRLTEAFIAGVARDYLNGLISRELVRHVGDGHRFATAGDHQRFLDEVAAHALACAKPVPNQAAQWLAEKADSGFSDQDVRGLAQGLLSGVRERLTGRDS